MFASVGILSEKMIKEVVESEFHFSLPHDDKTAEMWDCIYMTQRHKSGCMKWGESAGLLVLT